MPRYYQAFGMVSQLSEDVFYPESFMKALSSSGGHYDINHE